MESQIDGKELESLVLIGEMRHNLPIWSLPFDPTYSFTDGELRAIYMRLQRMITSEDFEMNKVYFFHSGEEVFFTNRPIIDDTTIFCIILRNSKFNDRLTDIIKDVANRGGIYTSKKFYEEINDLYKRSEEPKTILSILSEQPDPENALNYIKEVDIDELPVELLANLLVLVGTNRNLVGNDYIFNAAKHLLKQIALTDGEEDNIDILLDAAFVISKRHLELQDLVRSSILFEQIANLASINNRLGLEISCRIRNARIAKLRGVDNGIQLLEILSPIDDGSLEVATQQDREEYYCLQGYAFYLLNDFKTAEDLYMMAILISEGSSFPSMNKAEAHWFIGRNASQNYSPEIATRELMTASAIAQLNGQSEMSILYSHLAAIAEIKWSNMLASAAIISKLESNISIAEYQGWQALSRMLKSYMHSDRNLREIDISIHSREIIRMVQNVFQDSQTDFAQAMLQELADSLSQFDENLLTEENEKEVLKFLITKTSTMIPIPDPIILLIANDGRLIMGGQVGADNWDNSISENDDLFSGALSAIMAILSEVISSSSPLRMVDAGQTQIMIEKSKVCIGALLVDRDLNVIRKALKHTVNYMEANYPGLEDWDGYSLDFSGVKLQIDQVFSEALLNVRE